MKSYKKTLKVVDADASFESIKIGESKDAANYAKEYFFEDIDIYESCFVILLDRANNIIGWAKISQGGVAGTYVDAKIIAKYAVDTLASHVIMLHNHPSGNLNPSSADLQLTTKVKKGLDFLNIVLLDHIIITADSFYSMADEGRM